jgi:hypothetical protein
LSLIAGVESLVGGPRLSFLQPKMLPSRYTCLRAGSVTVMTRAPMLCISGSRSRSRRQMRPRSAAVAPVRYMGSGRRRGSPRPNDKRQASVDTQKCCPRVTCGSDLLNEFGLLLALNVNRSTTPGHVRSWGRSGRKVALLSRPVARQNLTPCGSGGDRACAEQTCPLPIIAS